MNQRSKTFLAQWALVVSILVLAQMSSFSLAAVLVDTTTDGDDGECALDCTLREAVATAVFGEEVIVPPGVYSLTLGAITLDADRSLSGGGAAVTPGMADCRRE